MLHNLHQHPSHTVCIGLQTSPTSITQLPDPQDHPSAEGPWSKHICAGCSFWPKAFAQGAKSSSSPRLPHCEGVEVRLADRLNSIVAHTSSAALTSLSEVSTDTHVHTLHTYKHAHKWVVMRLFEFPFIQSVRSATQLLLIKEAAEDIEEQPASTSSPSSSVSEEKNGGCNARPVVSLLQQRVSFSCINHDVSCTSHSSHRSHSHIPIINVHIPLSFNRDGRSPTRARRRTPSCPCGSA